MKWINIYSDTNEPDEFGRWQRILIYKGFPMCIVGKNKEYDGYTIHDTYPRLHTLHDHSFFSYNKTDDFETIKKQSEERLNSYLDQIR